MFDIIIVTYNAVDSLKRCVRSVKRHTKNYLLTIVDNNSSDGTVQYLKSLKGANVILNKRNLGASGALNTAFRRTGNKFIAHLDDDVEVTGGWLDKLHAQIKRSPAIGMVGCKIVLPDNRIMSAEFRLKPEATAGSREIDRGQRDYIRECDAIIGAAWLMKREVAQKVGFFDERFFPSQYEDIDYCLRIRLGDYKIIYDGEVKVIHGHLFRHLNRCAKNRRLFYKKWANTLSRYPFRDTHPFNKHMSRGICYFKKNLFGRAVSEFYKAEMTGAGFGEPFYMGTALYSVGEYQKALGEFKTLSSLFPNETRFHRYLAILYGKAGLDKGRDREVDYLFAWLSGGRKPKQGI